MTNTSLEKPGNGCDIQPSSRQDPVLVRANYAMIAGILRENFSQWTPGLKQGQYYHYQRWQCALPWGRRNLSYWAYTLEDDVLSSCKLYEMVYRSKSIDYKIAGIGAVFTAERNRGHGWALRLLEKMIALSREQGFDGVMLNSDIDPAYYERVGFSVLSSRDFTIRLSEDYVKRTVQDLDRRFSSARDEYSTIRDVTLKDVDAMVRHHRRWLPHRPYGVSRSEEYWAFKLSREMYLHKNSALAWPKQEIIALNFDKHNGGYALFEQGSKSIRVLEMIGSEETCHSLWGQLLRLALRRKINVLRGWEGSAPVELKGVQLSNRTWSRPMILPLNEKLNDWVRLKPCPLLELDHY